MRRFVHVDEFIDDLNTDAYASWFFNIARLPAILHFKFEDQINQYKLLCQYDGKTYRVTDASHLGDVWLTRNFEQHTGCEIRVDINDCSDWSDNHG